MTLLQTILFGLAVSLDSLMLWATMLIEKPSMTMSLLIASLVFTIIANIVGHSMDPRLVTASE